MTHLTEPFSAFLPVCTASPSAGRCQATAGRPRALVGTIQMLPGHIPTPWWIAGKTPDEVANSTSS